MSTCSKDDLHSNIFAQLNERIDFSPKIGLIVSFDLDEHLKDFKKVGEIDLGSIKGYPKFRVSGHSGRLAYGRLSGVDAFVFEGRLHYYEGYTMNEVILPMQIASSFEIETMILTNFAGAINKDFKVGDFVVITDHISLFVPNCLKDQTVGATGITFPDMTEVYNSRLNCIIKNVAKSNNVPIHEGVYVQLPGPSFETPAEIRMLKCLGADIVGMSTASEAMYARYKGMQVCGISCISNMATGLSKCEQSYEDVNKVARANSDEFMLLVGGLIEKMNEEQILNED